MNKNHIGYTLKRPIGHTLLCPIPIHENIKPKFKHQSIMQAAYDEPTDKTIVTLSSTCYILSQNKFTKIVESISEYDIPNIAVPFISDVERRKLFATLLIHFHVDLQQFIEEKSNGRCITNVPTFERALIECSRY